MKFLGLAGRQFDDKGPARLLYDEAPAQAATLLHNGAVVRAGQDRQPHGTTVALTTPLTRVECLIGPDAHSQKPSLSVRPPHCPPVCVLVCLTVFAFASLSVCLLV